MLVSAVEPVAQVRGRLIGCFAVEGHHRRRHARNPDDMGAPAFVGDPRHFNDEGSTRDGSFETVPHDGYECSENEEEEHSDSTQSPARNKRNEVRRCTTIDGPWPFAPNPVEKKFCCRVLHRTFTIHQQVFNILDWIRTANYSEVLHAHEKGDGNLFRS